MYLIGIVISVSQSTAGHRPVQLCKYIIGIFLIKKLKKLLTIFIITFGKIYKDNKIMT